MSLQLFELVIDTSGLADVKRYKHPFHVSRPRIQPSAQKLIEAAVADQVRAQLAQLQQAEADDSSMNVDQPMVNIKVENAAEDTMQVEMQPPEDPLRKEKEERLKELERQIKETEERIAAIEQEKHLLFAQLKQVLQEEEKRKQEYQQKPQVER